MQKLGAFLILVRWYNLVMVALTQVLFRYCIILPVFRTADHALPLSNTDFFLLVLATMLISAAGYAINDYFDLRVDRINKPNKVIVGRLITRRTTILLHTLLNVMGVALALYLSWKIRYWPLAFIFLAVPMALWLYSVRFKRSFLTGNITIALLSAMVIPLVWLVEYRAASLQLTITSEMMQVNFFVRFYSFFAFLTSLIREIVKDMEDYVGDKKTGCRSLAVVSGLETTRMVVMALMAFTILMIVAYMVYLGYQGRFTIVSYFLVLVVIPFSLVFYHVSKALGVLDFGNIQQILKLIMLAGVLSMIVQYFFIGSDAIF
ncbi:MAG: geranylgeranylglycerol-phosphate geranylgeranyltransferase [Bacteroides sp.]|jgi:4-hydroxybenzoate polyprenyltransferase|nr:geranylgeranylglycerol-phosphate geranylgeranyltransferase [Bacteroides sp.]